MTRSPALFSHGLRFRKWIAAGLCCWWPVSFAAAQQIAIEPVRPSAPVFWRPYLAPEVPPVRLANSPRLRDLVRAGKIYLSEQDAIALALENNIDIEVARYNPILSAWRLERAQAGGALPGVPSGASQAISVASGQGVLGSQAAAGVSGGGGPATANRGGGNAQISQIGPVTQTLDPSFEETTTFSHQTIPQPNVVQSITPVLLRNQRVYSGSLQEGFLSGGGVSLSYNDHFLNENAPSDVLNPSSAATLSIFVQHNLLRGLGIAVNGRTITVSKINLQMSALNFKTQVIATVVNVLNTYHSLVADYEDVKARQSALDAAQTFYQDTEKQVAIGSMIELDAMRAKSQAAAARQNLAISQTNLAQHELQLKNLISRTGVADPVVAQAQIVPTDRIVIPEKDNLPPLKDMIQTALADRSDLAVEKENVHSAEVSALGTRNGVRPALVAFGGESHAGLAGKARTLVFGQFVETADPYTVGGIGTALGQIFRRNYPTENIGAFFQAQIYNRQASSDQAIDELQLRQTQWTTQKDLNQLEVDVMNAVVALQQARARYDAAAKNRELEQQLLDAEQRKFALGASTSYNVVQQERDLMAAQSSEIAALVSYSDARTLLDRTLGTTLETNHISLAGVERAENRK